MTGMFNAYDARSGKPVWSFNAQVSVVAPPISYRVGDWQFVTVIAGAGTSAGVETHAGIPIEYRRQQRRVLPLALDGRAILRDTAADR